MGGAATAHAVHAVAVSSHASSGAAPVGFNSGGGGGAAAAAGAGGGTGGEEGAVEMASWGGAGDGWARWWQSDMVTVVENSELSKGIRVLQSQARSGVDDDSEEAQRKRSVEEALRREMEEQRNAYLARRAQEGGAGGPTVLPQEFLPLPPAPLMSDTQTAAAAEGAVMVGPHGQVSVVGQGAAVVAGVRASGVGVAGAEVRAGQQFADTLQRQSAFDEEEFEDRDPDSD
eukprot:Tamp_08521.p3 GENE.Tamp_08521~~Tamp_08521.p3  ORF type:complete len:230 (-),score=58.77 Tamp_08521:216-905(-)